MRGRQASAHNLEQVLATETTSAGERRDGYASLAPWTKALSFTAALAGQALVPAYIAFQLAVPGMR